MPFLLSSSTMVDSRKYLRVMGISHFHIYLNCALGGGKHFRRYEEMGVAWKSSSLRDIIP